MGCDISSTAGGSGNPATLAPMLDLCAAIDATEITVKDIAEAAGITEGAVRGQLAGLTMKIRNPRYGYPQTRWPVHVGTMPKGAIRYDMDPELAAVWRSIRISQGPSRSINT